MAGVTADASMERRVIASAALAHGMTHTLELTFAALLLRIGTEFGAPRNAGWRGASPAR
ncbi:MAG: hypothetical protein U0360_03220 [Dehalococcoidia bacterium]